MVDRVHDHEANTVDTGAPVPVSVDYVEAQLNELWRDVAEAAQTTGGIQAVTTAHVLNLIVRAESERAVNDYLRDVEHITGLHPCRVIVTAADSSQQEMPVQAWVSIHCQLPPTGGRQVCCEQVSVVGSGQSVRQLPAAVIPLLIPDLPVFLWWPSGAPFDDYLFRNLADSINRLIVDSSTFENSEGTLAKMHHRLQSNWPKVYCTDMSWARLTQWREMLAQFFDPPNVRPYLDQIGQVTIEYALSQRGAANRSQALLFAGWLASRLGWEATENTYELVHSEKDSNLPPTLRLSLRSGKRIITISLNAADWKSDVPGEIVSVKMEVPGGAPDAQPKASFAIWCSDKPDECAWIESQVEGAEPIRRPIQLETPARSHLLDSELDIFSRDRIYEEALETVGVFIRGADFKPRSIQPPRRVVTGEPMSAGSTSTTRPQATVRPATPAAQAQPPSPGNGAAAPPPSADNQQQGSGPVGGANSGQ